MKNIPKLVGVEPFFFWTQNCSLFCRFYFSFILRQVCVSLCQGSRSFENLLTLNQTSWTLMRKYWLCEHILFIYSNSSIHIFNRYLLSFYKVHSLVPNCNVMMSKNRPNLFSCAWRITYNCFLAKQESFRKKDVFSSNSPVEGYEYTKNLPAETTVWLQPGRY